MRPPCVATTVSPPTNQYATSCGTTTGPRAISSAIAAAFPHLAGRQLAATFAFNLDVVVDATVAAAAAAAAAVADAAVPPPPPPCMTPVRA